jgi:putative SOS response-associated peptidase YedK
MCYSALLEKNLDVLKFEFGAHMIKDRFENLHKLSSVDAKKYPPIEAERIFPGHYAPVLFMHNKTLVIEPMRYGAEPPEFVNSKSYSSFNARRDNLTSPFWGQMFRKNHGFVVLKGFYEWVKVSALLKTGRVSLTEIQKEFAEQSKLRQSSLEKAGKKYKPTPTELKDPRFRDIVIEFKPSLQSTLYVPVIFADETAAMPFKSFAIITDEPPVEVSSAGHDRCPVMLSKQSLREWLVSMSNPAHIIDQILSVRPAETFMFELAKAS